MSPTLSGWGRQSAPGRERRGESLQQLTENAALCRGLGRSYGDASLPPPDHPFAVSTVLADRILAFEQASGLLHAEAGLSLSEMNRVLLPAGWFTPVSPGTQFVTLGGMVAADVHGKNQHIDGNIGHHVTRLRMRVADGRIVWCSRDEHADLFRATLGGMGLTGHILEVELRLRRVPSTWIVSESERIGNIDDFQEALEAAAGTWPYTMGWIDCVSRGRHLGRGILMRGRWADAVEAPVRAPRPRWRPRLPIDLPAWALGRHTVRAFNEIYYRRHPRGRRREVVPADSFFYPLDAIREWNRMYGRRGFTQYQCVLPKASGAGSARRLLEVLTSRGGASFLCVIKDFGRDGEGLLSFPMPGITIAFDLSIRDQTPRLIEALNQHVIEEGGRIYLAKDAFTRPDQFRLMERERLEVFERVRDRWDPERKLRSAQSVRLLGDPA